MKVRLGEDFAFPEGWALTLSLRKRDAFWPFPVHWDFPYLVFPAVDPSWGKIIQVLALT